MLAATIRIAAVPGVGEPAGMSSFAPWNLSRRRAALAGYDMDVDTTAGVGTDLVDSGLTAWRHRTPHTGVLSLHDGRGG